MSKIARAIATDLAQSEASTAAKNAVTTYSGEVSWPVLYQVRYDIEATSPEEAMAKMKQAMEDDVAMDDPNRCFFELSESCDNSDGPNTLAIWDEEQRNILLEEPSDERRYAEHGEELVMEFEKLLGEWESALVQHIYDYQDGPDTVAALEEAQKETQRLRALIAKVKGA